MCENIDNRFDETSSNQNGSSSGVVAGEFIPEPVIINTSGFSQTLKTPTHTGNGQQFMAKAQNFSVTPININER